MMLQGKPDIAVFSLAYSPFEGGAEVACREIMKCLPGLNFAVFTYKFDRNWPDREQEENIEIIRLGRGGKRLSKYGRILGKIIYIFRAWREAEKLHKEKNFKAIWAIMASYGGIAALFFKINHPEIPFLLTIQEGDSEGHLIFGRLGLIGLFFEKIVSKADYIQAISNYLKDFVQKRGAKRPIEVIPNGVDLKLFRTEFTEEEKQILRDNLGITDEYVIITVSRLVYKNGVDILMEAVAKVKEKIPNIKCLIAGEGPEYKKLKIKSEKLKIDNNILFLGQIKQKDIPLYLKISDVFVRPSRSEGLGNSFLEAMAAGIPVIGTPVGGIPDFLADGETGLIIKENDSGDLSDKIIYILRNPDIKKEVVVKAVRLVNKNYSWGMISKDFKEIFDNLLK